MKYPDLRTEAQYRQELATCWQIIESDKEAFTRLQAENAALAEQNEKMRKAIAVWCRTFPTCVNPEDREAQGAGAGSLDGRQRNYCNE